MSKILRALLIDDDTDDYLILERLLERCVDYHFEVEQSVEFEDALFAIRNGEHDVYFVDYRLGDRDGIELLELAKSAELSGPFLLLTGQGDRDIAIKAASAGAADYLVKSELTSELLERSVRYALERQKLLEQLTERARETDCLYQISKVVEHSDSLSELFTDLLPLVKRGLKHPEHCHLRIVYDCENFESDHFLETQSAETFFIGTGDNQQHCLQVYYVGLLDATERQSNQQLFQTVSRTLSEAIKKRKAEDEIRKMARFAADNPSPVLRILSTGKIIYANDAAIPLLKEMGVHRKQLSPRWTDEICKLIETNTSKEREFECSAGLYSLLFTPIPEENYVNVYGSDITRRKQAELLVEERAALSALAAQIGFILTRGNPITKSLRECVTLITQRTSSDLTRLWRIERRDCSLFLSATSGGTHEHLPVGSVLSNIPQHLQPAIQSGEMKSTEVTKGLLSGFIVTSFPLMVEGSLVGIMELYSTEEFSKSTLDTLTFLADEIALGIKHQQAVDQNSRLVAILEATPDFVGIFDPQFNSVYFNHAARSMLGVADNEDITSVRLQERYPDWARNTLMDEALPTALKHGIWRGQLAFKVDEKEIPVSQVLIAHRNEKSIEFLSTIARDMTESKSLEEQLRQVQKLEGIGRLAGGVAHDFNNLLTGISGFTDLAANNTTEEQVLRDLMQVRDLCDRASDLTRQLLAFSRRQPLSPVIININEQVERTTRMLQRLIGENIRLNFDLADSVWNVRVDPGQLEQILANLVINARDAMPEGGKLFIETRNAVLNQHYAERHPSSPSGHYVMLAITDTGHGMDPDTKERIFEPFFTTKSVGKGTGLGLSTVYGIVKQHQGNIWVYSEPDHGTTFKIYLPRVDQPKSTNQSPVRIPPKRGSEQILLVEDEDPVRKVTRRALELNGYSVLAVKDPLKAFDIYKENSETVSLLLTDVVMPGLSGRALYKQISDHFPDLKVLFMSGYTDDAVVQHGVLEANVPFIQKPFDAATLVNKVRDVLDNL